MAHAVKHVIGFCLGWGRILKLRRIKKERARAVEEPEKDYFGLALVYSVPKLHGSHQSHNS